MKKELLALTASLALVSSMSASVSRTAMNQGSNNLGISRLTATSSLIAREREPGDDRGKHKGGKDDGKGHKVTPQVAREKEPGDDRGKHKGGKDDGKGHKFAQEVAREAQPGDKKGKGQDGTGHKLTQEVAREAEPGDDRGRDRGRGRGKDDGKGHKLV